MDAILSLQALEYEGDTELVGPTITTITTTTSTLSTFSNGCSGFSFYTCTKAQ